MINIEPKSASCNRLCPIKIQEIRVKENKVIIIIIIIIITIIIINLF